MWPLMTGIHSSEAALFYRPRNYVFVDGLLPENQRPDVLHSRRGASPNFDARLGFCS